MYLEDYFRISNRSKYDLMLEILRLNSSLGTYFNFFEHSSFFLCVEGHRMSFLISKISFSDEDECLMGGTKREQRMCFQMKTNRFENAFKSGEI